MRVLACLTLARGKYIMPTAHCVLSTAIPGLVLMCPAGPPTQVMSHRMKPGSFACFVVQEGSRSRNRMMRGIILSPLRREPSRRFQ